MFPAGYVGDPRTRLWDPYLIDIAKADTLNGGPYLHRD